MWLIVLAISVLFCSTASAYIDPGSGSLILQLVIGGAAALIGTFKIWGAKFFGKKKKGEENDVKSKKDKTHAA